MLRAARDLGGLYEGRRPEFVDEIDCARGDLVHEIDCWVAAEMPLPVSAASMHTETLGMVVDRLARYSVDAYVALAAGLPEWRLHHAWKRLAELSIGYADLSSEIGCRTRRLPDLSLFEPRGEWGRAAE
ncbi:DUF4254 domain-containing protein [Nocardia sp. NPDC051570]|uniref:DUF4254 domain-containing protein n=1 Tax=Nocardia sp. NPDC051570 TaxID=3364324 RepID=UPI003795D278